MEYQRICHPFAPVFDENSKVLILGTLPSVASREQAFYYGHSRNRFWKVLASITCEAVPVTTGEKRDLLLRHGLALWDVIDSCDIRGSDDSSIRNVIPTDLSRILNAAPIERIYANGTKAAQLYEKYQLPQTGIPASLLPSTSPANAAWSLERLCAAWSEIII